ncbi:hypothetical protein P2R30_01780, partial [Escherichia coli]
PGWTCVAGMNIRESGNESGTVAVRMEQEKIRCGKRKYTAGAMCFMLFVWLGGVVTLCVLAALITQ